MTTVVSALQRLTQKFIAEWQELRGCEPCSDLLYGIASPCIVKTEQEQVFWLPQLMCGNRRLSGTEDALNILLRDEVHEFYTTQFAGDISGVFNQRLIHLIQVWSNDDYLRLQENLIGHLVTQRRLKLTPTLFIGTTNNELEVISVCNLSGKVILEHLGTAEHIVLAPNLYDFLNEVLPCIDYK